MRVLLNGGSHGDLDAIRHLRALGCQVFTTGNKPEELGHGHADGYVFADFSSIDAVRAVVDRVRPDAIVPSCNDFSYLTACALARESSLPGYDIPDVASTLHHKDRFRALCASLGVPSPRHVATTARRARDDAAALRYPVLVKSTDLSGGKGIARCETPDEVGRAAVAAARLSRRDGVVVEEFFDGDLCSCSTFLRGRRVAFAYFDREYLCPGSFLVQTSVGPVDPGVAVRQGVVRAIEAVAGALGLVDGLLHAQFLARGDSFAIVEFTRRCPGDLYCRPVDMLFGAEFYTSSVVAPFIGREMPATTADFLSLPGDRFVARACAIAPPGLGAIRDIRLDPAIEPTLRESVIYSSLPRSVTAAGGEKVGVFFLSFADFGAAEAVARDFGRFTIFRG